MTNGDKIRAMTDEEFAKFLCNMHTVYDCCRCVASEFCSPGHNGMLDWLRSEAKE